MTKASTVAAMVAAILLAGCSDYQAGDAVVANVQKDPDDQCRIITAHLDDIPPMTARVDGCPVAGPSGLKM